MQKEIIRELDHTYLVPEDIQIDETEYMLQMALRGRLPGILPLSITGKDGKRFLRADVTACTSIASRYKNVALTGSDLRKILSSVRDTAQKMPGLLMTAQDLLLDPECIFLGPGGDEVLLCYIPHLSGSEPCTIRILSEFILKHVDHSDQAAAGLAYDLYEQVSAESFLLPDLLSELLIRYGPDAEPSTGTGTQNSGETSWQSWQNRSPDNPSSYAPGSNPPADSRPRSAKEARAGTRAGGSPGSFHQDAFSRNSTKAADTASRDPYSPSGDEGFYAGGADFAEFSMAKMKRLPSPRKKKNALRHLIPALIILPSACILIFLFQMDLTQILGMGFLCIALIWIIHVSLEKRANERRNIWYDEDPDAQSDDQFYQALRKELYDDSSPGSYSGGPDQERFSRENTPEDRTTLLRSTCPVLVSLQKDRSPDLPLDRDHLILGKSRSLCDIILPGDTISRKHARIEHRTDGYYVTDLFSTNGTFLDGHRLESGQAVMLKDSAQLTIASLHFRVSIP